MLLAQLPAPIAHQDHFLAIRACILRMPRWTRVALFVEDWRTDEGRLVDKVRGPRNGFRVPVDAKHSEKTPANGQMKV